MKTCTRRLWIFLLVLGLISCKRVTIEEQRTQATQYQENSMLAAQEAAESGARTLCSIDFEAGVENYQDEICEATTNLGCKSFSKELELSWTSMEETFDTPKLVCEWVSSDFIEESSQFGLPVQVWHIRMVGTVGWPESQTNRDFWMQLAFEDSAWKLHRILSLTEINYYIERLQGTPVPTEAASG